MIEIFTFFLSIVIGIYLLFYGIAISIWYKIPENALPNLMNMPLVSVLVACRNEEEHLSDLLLDLSKQCYPKQQLEIIIIDDHSTDLSATIISDCINNAYPFKLKKISCPDHIEGKKEAITLGVHQAIGELILVTDADCRMNPNWVSTIVSQFNPKTKMVLSPVRMLSNNNNLISQVSTIEFHALQLLTGFFVQIKRPLLANAANMAFRKEVFFEVGGYSGNIHQSSGDDVYLLAAIKSIYPKGIIYNKSRSGIVTTLSPDTLSDIINQKVRWAGKWQAMNSTWLIGLALGTFITHLLMLIGYVFLFFFVKEHWMIFSLLSIKVIVDYCILKTIHRFLNLKYGILKHLVPSIFYPLYVLSIALLSLKKKFVWKGRHY